MEQINIKTVNQNVVELIKIVQEMKESLEDRFLTMKEIRNIKVAEEEFKNNETISLEDLKKELDL
jgi:hypothetical protein